MQGNAVEKSRVIFIILGLLILSGTVLAQDSTAGSFLYSEDAFHKIVDLSGFWMIKLEDQKNWSLINIPSQTRLGNFFTLKRKFGLDSSSVALQHRLVAEGIDYEAAFAINNVNLGSHRGGYNAFEINLESNILHLKGDNEIVLEVKTEHTPRTTIPVRYWPQGPQTQKGVHRSLYLLSRPKIRIEKWQARTQVTGAGRADSVQIVAELQSDLVFPAANSSRFYWQVLITDSTQARVIPIMASRSVRLLSQSTVRDTLWLPAASLELWTPERPKRYDLQILLWQDQQLIDRVSQKVGFRALAVQDSDFYLNGEKCFIKCFDWVEDLPNDEISIDSLQKRHRFDLQQIKATGANAVRVRFFPPHHSIPEICDEIGMLLLLEIPVQFMPTDLLIDQKFKKDVASYLRETILRDRTHASIIAWGLGAGYDFGHPQTLTFVSELKQMAAQWDDRPVYVELLKKDGARNLGPVDFYLVNLNALTTWQTANYITGDLQLPVDRPAIVTFGLPYLPSATIWAEPNRAEEAQAYQIEDILQRLKKVSGIAGISIATLTDWHSGEPWLNFGFETNSNIQRYGLLDQNRKPRVAFSVVKAFFTGNEPIHVSPVKTVEAYPIIYPIAGILFLLFFLLSYRRDRPLRVNFGRIFVHPHGFYMDLRDNRRVSIWHSLLLALASCLFIGITVSSLLTSYRNLPIAAHLMDYLFRNIALKEKIIWLIWHTEWNLLALTVLTFLLMVVMTLYMVLTAFILRRNLSFRQGFTLMAWVGASWLLALPISIVLIRLTHEGHLTSIAIILILCFLVWFLVRFYRGFRVALVLSNGQAILVLLIMLGLWLGLLAFYLHQRLAFFDYLPYFYSIMMH